MQCCRDLTLSCTAVDEIERTVSHRLRPPHHDHDHHYHTPHISTHAFKHARTHKHPPPPFLHTRTRHAQDGLARELKECEANLAETQRHLDKLIPEHERLGDDHKKSKATVLDLTAQVDRSLAEMRSATFQNESVLSQLKELQKVVVEISGKSPKEAEMAFNQ